MEKAKLIVNSERVVTMINLMLLVGEEGDGNAGYGATTADAAVILSVADNAVAASETRLSVL